MVHVFVATAPREFNFSLKVFGKRINDWKLSCSPSVYTNSEFQLLTWFWTSILIGSKYGLRTPNEGTYKSKISEISGRCGRQNMLRPYLKYLKYLNLELVFDFRPCSEGTRRPFIRYQNENKQYVVSSKLYISSCWRLLDDFIQKLTELIMTIQQDKTRRW